MRLFQRAWFALVVMLVPLAVTPAVAQTQNDNLPIVSRTIADALARIREFAPKKPELSSWVLLDEIQAAMQKRKFFSKSYNQDFYIKVSLRPAQDKECLDTGRSILSDWDKKKGDQLNMEYCEAFFTLGEAERTQAVILAFAYGVPGNEVCAAQSYSYWIQQLAVGDYIFYDSAWSQYSCDAAAFPRP